ncbi:MAG: diacylglycerol kinase family protein [Sphingomonadaceae bacterium]
MLMETFTRAWLIANEASGSNSPSALDDLRSCFAEHAITVDRTICFPDEDLPAPEDLVGADIGLLVVYTGDGTINAALSGLAGWPGAVLVLPGGTMNLLSQRLHGAYGYREIIGLVASRGARRCRVTVLQCEAGCAYADCLIGPGTQWADVREAMREFNVVDMASSAAEAFSQSTGGVTVWVDQPELGRRQGYPLIEITPGEHGLRLNAYHAQSLGEMAQQGWALLRRRFREGPHERLGIVDEVTVASSNGAPLDVLLDGEPATLDQRASFTLATSECDLLATHHG